MREINKLNLNLFRSFAKTLNAEILRGKLKIDACDFQAKVIEKEI